MKVDPLRSTPFAAPLRRLLADTLAPGERVLWQGQPDGLAHMMMWRWLWWIGFPWLVLTSVAGPRGWLGEWFMFPLLFGLMLVASPLVMLLHDLQTLCVITDRRALILRTAWGKPGVKATAFADMDATLEVLGIGRGAGHLNFASGVSTRSPDTDYAGRYGFRCISHPERVRDILERARTGRSRPA